MALLTLDQAKGYVRCETTAEDTTVLTPLLASAIAVVRQLLDRPIEAAERTYVLEDQRGASFARAQLRSAFRVATVLRIPDAPVDTTKTITLTDGDGVVWDTADYRVESWTGIIRSVTGCGFGRFPYTVVATTGLAVRSDYATAVEPALNAAIADIFADLYQRRNPAATAEKAAGGDSVTYGRLEETIPRRALDLIARFRRPSL